METSLKRILERKKIWPHRGSIRRPQASTHTIGTTPLHKNGVCEKTTDRILSCVGALDRAWIALQSVYRVSWTKAAPFRRYLRKMTFPCIKIATLTAKYTTKPLFFGLSYFIRSIENPEKYIIYKFQENPVDRKRIMTL